MPENDQLPTSIDIPESIKTEVYRDLAHPAVQHLGRWIGAVCGKLDKYSAKMEIDNEAAVRSILEHYNKVPPEYRTHPKPRITYDAEQSFHLAAGEPELQKLFVNLIKSCCDTRTAQGVLPSFVQILRQLTPDEAKILKNLFSYEKTQYRSPIIKIRVEFTKATKGGLDLTGLISPLYWKSNCEFPNNGPIYLDNLQRLKLIDVVMTSQFTDLDLYKEVENHPEVIKAIDEIKKTPEQKPTIVRGILKLTDFGQALCVACNMSNALQDK